MPSGPDPADRLPTIRPYREQDLAAVYDICVRTAGAGADARGKYHTDDPMPAQAGAAGVHVVVVAENVQAIGFYRHLGFTPVEVNNPGVVYLGRRL